MEKNHNLIECFFFFFFQDTMQNLHDHRIFNSWDHGPIQHFFRILELPYTSHI